MARRIRLSSAASLTVRHKILLAFLGVSVITALLGGYAAVSLARTGQLVVETYDHSLMSINYAHAVAADFAAMEAAHARRRIASPGRVEALARVAADLAETLDEDLAVAADRSLSPKAVGAAASVRATVAKWEAARAVAEATPAVSALAGLDLAREAVSEAIDVLINHTAGYGFLRRQQAVAAVAQYRMLAVAGTLAALALAATVAVLLARLVMGPVAAASAAAGRIAAGQLDTPIPRAGRDELGALLAAMTRMRDNIRAMVEREIAGRRSAQGRLVDAIESSREGVALADGEGRVVIANSQWARFFAGSFDPGCDFAAAMGAAGAEDGERAVAGRWLRVSRSATADGGFVAIASDVTAARAQQAAIEQTNLHFAAALSNMSQGLCLFDAADRLLVGNRRFCDMFALPPERVRPGVAIGELLALAAAAAARGSAPGAMLGERAALLARGPAHTRVEEFADGRVITVMHQPLADGGWLSTFEDVTERRRAEAQISFMARHDALTHLPNRALFRERMEQAAASLGRGAAFAVLCLDLDHFKTVNDTLGHPVGDALLRQVAERLSACARETDTVARLGGDEFALLQAGVDRPEAAGELARRIVQQMSEPFQVEGHMVVIGASVGIVVAPGDGSHGDTLLRNADTALYRAKLDGRGMSRFFEADMDARLQARRTLEMDLRLALAGGQLELFYQPLMDLRLDRVSSVEALLRWRHPTRGMVSPAEFIPVAEEIGLIVPIGEWVLAQACAEAAGWPGEVKVAVNVSPVQFKSPRLVEAVAEALGRSGLPSRRLEVEITESVLLQDNDATLATLHRIRDLGVRISMDDFGTGYSSLSYLRSFPFDKIKIDQSFIRDLSTRADSGAIVRAITGLGQTLGMRTTAEGVETAEQLARLRAEGCNEVQGYLFSRPAPAAELPALIARLNHAEVACA